MWQRSRTRRIGQYYSITSVSTEQGSRWLHEQRQSLSAPICQAHTEKLTVNQLTLHFLGRHEWEIKITASARRTLTTRRSFSLKCTQQHHTLKSESLTDLCSNLTTAELWHFLIPTMCLQSSRSSQFSNHIAHLSTEMLIKTKRGMRSLQMHRHRRLLSIRFFHFEQSFL